MDPITAAAFANHEKRVWKNDLNSAPHGEEWHTSFHASRFPGDDPKACGRKAVYELLNLPAAGPFDPKVAAMGEVGKAIEMLLVRRWHDEGRLLSAGPNETVQTGFIDPKVWLTGNTDAVLLRPFHHRPHVVDVKSKDHDVVLDMLYGRRSFDPDHRHQILTYIAGFHEQHPWSTVMICKDTWTLADHGPLDGQPKSVCRVHKSDSCLQEIELEPAIDGSLYYVSRSRPRVTAEFYFEYDPAFMIKGRTKLAEWKQHFVDGTLPERPKDWKWSEPPCQYCPLKKEVCKKDYQAGITDLSESHALAYAQTLRPSWDYAKTREAVQSRWEEKAA